MKIIKTNWINILGVFLSLFIYSIILNITSDGVMQTFFQSILAALVLVSLYGILFWVMFAILLVILDIVLIVRSKNNLKLKLLLEWLIISCPFLYWTAKYNEWIFLVAIIAFLITQLLREKLITKTTN